MNNATPVRPLDDSDRAATLLAIKTYYSSYDNSQLLLTFTATAYKIEWNWDGDWEEYSVGTWSVNHGTLQLRDSTDDYQLVGEITTYPPDTFTLSDGEVSFRFTKR